MLVRLFFLVFNVIILDMKKIIVNVLIFALLVFLAFYKLPYTVTFEGGIYNVNDKYKLENKTKLKGSINVVYVSEVQPNLPYLIYAHIRGYEIEKIKKDSEIDYDKSQYLSVLLYKESIANAVYAAYTKADKDIKISNSVYYIYYVFSESNSSLQPGDRLISIDGVLVNEDNSVKDLINSSSNNIVDIKYERDGKEYSENVELLVEEGEKYLGVYLINVFDYETNPKIEYKPENNVSGPSGGAMMTLSIYCHLIDEDLTKGRIITGTGTMSKEGIVGPVGGINYKIKSAAKKGDIFFVPAGENYEEAKATKEKENLDIEIVPVKTFDDIINYLKK